MCKRLIVLLSLVSLSALADDAVLTWTNPSRTESCVDAGPYTNPAGTDIWMKVARISDPDEVTTTLFGLKPGTYEYVATSYSQSGEVSKLSGSATKVVIDFSMKTETAYYVIQQSGVFILLPVGKLPIGTACNPEQEVNGKYAVDVALLYSESEDEDTPYGWTGTARPLVVVAQCG